MAKQSGRKQTADPKNLGSSLPPGFLDFESLCLLPSFYQPETEDLRWQTHYNIRKTLFDAVFRNVKYCEYKRLHDHEEDYFAVDKIEDVGEGALDMWIEKYWSGEQARGKLIQTQKWTI